MGAAAHLSALTLGSAASVALEALLVAVTGLIAGWPGVTVTLLFLSVSLFATAGTLAAPFFLICLDCVIAVLAVLGMSTARRLAAGLRERNRLRRRIAVHRQRLDAIRSHVARLRRAVQTRERVLKAREVELAQAISGHEAAFGGAQACAPPRGRRAARQRAFRRDDESRDSNTTAWIDGDDRHAAR